MSSASTSVENWVEGDNGRRIRDLDRGTCVSISERGQRSGKVNNLNCVTERFTQLKDIDS